MRTAIETKDATGDQVDVKAVVAEAMNALNAFKETHKTEIAEIKRTGVPDPVTTDKLVKIEKSLGQFEDINQKLTLAAAEAKKATDATDALTTQMGKLEAKLGRPPNGSGVDETKEKQHALEYKAAFAKFCRTDQRYLTLDEFKLLDEYKVLTAGADATVGYYLAPPELAGGIIKAVVLQSPMRSLARVTSIGGPSYKLAKRTGVFAATRVGETATRSETTGYTAGMVEVFCPEMYAEVHISQQMLEDSMFDLEAEMQMEFSEQFAVKEGAEFISGLGAANQAEGILTSTATRTSVSGSAAALTGDGLINAFFGTSSTTGLKSAYARNATWIFNRATLGAIRKLKDGNGQYLWLPGIVGNVPNTILGAPYVEMPDMPDVGANLYAVAVGDFSRGYVVVDRVLMSVLRDPFTIANAGQILFRARKRVGGAVILGESIVTHQCHT